MTVVSGTVATLLGGWLGDRLLRRTPAAYQLVSAVGMALSIPAIVVAIYLQGPAMYPAIFLGEFFLLLNTAPLNAALVNSVSARIRATALAVNVFTIHAAGRCLLAHADRLHFGPQQSGDGVECDGGGGGAVGGGAVLRHALRAEDRQESN